jgi:hypothetical protein
LITRSFRLEKIGDACELFGSRSDGLLKAAIRREVLTQRVGDESPVRQPCLNQQLVIPLRRWVQRSLSNHKKRKLFKSNSFLCVRSRRASALRPMVLRLKLELI